MYFKKVSLWILYTGMALSLLNLLWGLGFYIYTNGRVSSWGVDITDNIRIKTSYLHFSGSEGYYPQFLENNFFLYPYGYRTNPDVADNLNEFVSSDYIVEAFLLLDEKNYDFVKPRVIAYLIDEKFGTSGCYEVEDRGRDRNTLPYIKFEKCRAIIDKYHLPPIDKWERAKPRYFITEGYATELFLVQVLILVLLGGTYAIFCFSALVFTICKKVL